MTRIIASISRSLHYEALLMKRARLTEAQLFAAGRFTKERKRGARGNAGAIRTETIAHLSGEIIWLIWI